ncbi:hypothetical protein CGZ60_02820 [Neisseria animalis]|nr:hypothetical protein CGZ60_02820 [Neisseria animalis]
MLCLAVLCVLSAASLPCLILILFDYKTSYRKQSAAWQNTTMPYYFHFTWPHLKNKTAPPKPPTGAFKNNTDLVFQPFHYKMIFYA